MNPINIIILIIAVVVFRIIADSFDRERIRSYFGNKGGGVRSITWTPFGPGWFGEKNARIYRVEYSDFEGNMHRCTVKTSMFAGVYITDDYVWAKRKK